MSITQEMISKVVASTLERAAVIPSRDGMAVLLAALERETNPSAKEALRALLANLELARRLNSSMCQTFATPAVHINLGTSFQLGGVDLVEAVREGCRVATVNGFLRPSCVHPITRRHLGGNVGRQFPDIQIELKPNCDFLELIAFSTTTLPASRTVIWLPGEIGERGEKVIRAVVEWAMEGGAMLCPPIAVGVGIGGDLLSAAKMTRRALLRGWDVRNPEPEITEWEARLLSLLNKTGIGPFGLGGDTFALAVNVEMGDTHAAAVPISVEYYCWASALRRARARISPAGVVEYD